MMIDDSYFMELPKAIRESSGQDNKTRQKKAGPRRLALAQPKKKVLGANHS